MKQIITLGGGGFSMEPENPLLDRYIMNQVNKDKIKISFIPTASGDSQTYIDNFYNFFRDYNCESSHLSLFKGKTKYIRDFILSQDIIYVGGGNTINLLVLWKEWGLDKFLQEAYENGILLCGISAGSICWFEQGLTDSVPNELNPVDCLGFLKGSNCPHFDGEANRKPEYIRFVNQGQLKPGYGVDDGAAIHFIDDQVHKIVSSRPNAKVYFIEKNTEKIINPIYLG